MHFWERAGRKRWLCPPAPGGGTPSPLGLPWNAGSHTEGSTVRGGQRISLFLGPPQPTPQVLLQTGPPRNSLPRELSTAVLWLVLKSPSWTRILQPHMGTSLYTTPPSAGVKVQLLFWRGKTQRGRGRGLTTQHLRRRHLTCPECSPFSLPMDIPHSAVSCVHALCVSQRSCSQQPLPAAQKLSVASEV